MAAADLHNSAIADALEELGDLYELDGAVVHRVLAYRNAARSIRESPVSVATLARQGRARELPKVGETIEGKILALLDTGDIPAAKKLRERFPAGLIEITRLPGLGAKRARLLYDELGIDSPQALGAAARGGKLQAVKGLGAKFEQRVLGALEAGPRPRGNERLLLPQAIEMAESIVSSLRQHGPADLDIEIAGSIRRGVEAVKDVDLVAVTESPQQLLSALAKLEQIESVSSASLTAARGLTHSGLPIDLRIAPPKLKGSLLQHFTGSAAHNAALREIAVKEGLDVSEHGIEDDRGGETIRCETETQVYDALRLSWIPPELREHRGELVAARLKGEREGRSRTGKRERQAREDPRDAEASGEEGRLPRLVAERDIKGDLHCHTIASDGVATIEDMAATAKERGYAYLAITDHSATHGFGNDVSPDELLRQIERVREIDSQMEGFTLLAGSEVNILPDGSLDYGDEILQQLDWVVASVHTFFRMSSSEMTKRIVTAIEHPCVDVIGHPTGRKIEKREPYELDLEAVIEAALRTGTFLEINGAPDRRDLPEMHARAASRAGVKLVIDSDAHRPATLANIRWGVLTARRAWLTKDDVANTRTWDELAGIRKRGRSHGLSARSY